MRSTTFELLANFLAPSDQMHLVGRPFHKEKNSLAVRNLIAHFSRSAQDREN